MLRLRRYRVFMICAFVITFLLYHVSRNSQWDGSQPTIYDKVDRPTYKPNTQHDADKVGQSQRPPSDTKPEPVDSPVPVEEAPVKIPQLKTTSEVKGGFGLPKAAPTTTSDAPKAQKTDAEESSTTRPAVNTVPVIELPDRVPNNGHKDQDGPIKIWTPPKKLDDDEVEAAAIHWEKPKEWFPVAKESLIPLPTGTPKPMPSVQFKFKEETEEAKQKRERRLAKVKTEAQRAWSGYKQFAWTHDELTPVTKHGKDPFCGWAATLVDSLDTLWIMGLKDEFDDAVAAVKEIDFTTTPYRSDIPVFETIIRYLGGLIAAYDVTGGPSGKYRVLLDKAIELAEILMSVFDTPNRMPILYYNWQPEFNQNPKRASTSVSVAEIGSMGMEFTRLAQLTGENKYYDAIARITDALEELQNRQGGTALPGIFPQQLDASGCNRTATAAANMRKSEALRKQMEDAKALDDEPQGYTADNVSKTHPSTSSGGKDLEFEVMPGSNPEAPGTGLVHEIKKRDFDDGPVEETSPDSTTTTTVVEERSPPTPKAPVTASGLPENWECVPQGLDSGSYGMDSYSMGGSQDSAYEYFPKQFALLGGLEPKYRTMHEKTVAAVKKYLLFRPMAQGDPDVLFSAKATSSDGTDENLRYEWEITHLTCFLGGMFGLGGQLFERPEDVEIGKKLTDGCVWAYDVMPTGIMPEFSMTIPCAKADDCHWNKTAWHEHLDPQSTWRQSQLEQYLVDHAEWKEEIKRLKAQEAQRLEAKEAAKKEAAAKAAQKAKEEEEERKLRPVNNTLPGDNYKPSVNLNDPADADKDLRDNHQQHHTKRDLSTEDDDDKKIEEKVEKLESELDLNSGTVQHHSSLDTYDPNEDSQQPLNEDIYYPAEPTKPLSHTEYVAQRLKNERLPPGFASLNDRRYILRPEAIESVWYMYRITGDPIWQEKGWRMFNAVIRATRTEVGHSAIEDVTADPADGQPLPTDSMESFWLAETLKYFYLLFAEPDVISLDEWVLNTEAHPFRRPVGK